MVGVVIDICNVCNGCWLDGNEATSLTRSRGKNAVSVALVSTKDSPLNCPSCGTKSMLEGGHQLNQSLILDQCTTCSGVWLDKGELTTLLGLRAAP
jgi:Zn-finger nucleic acid-binding protein